MSVYSSLIQASKNEELSLWDMQSYNTKILFIIDIRSSVSNLSNRKTRHTTSGLTWDGARRGIGAGRGQVARNAEGSVRLEENRSTYPPRHRTHMSWTSSQKHKQAKSYINRWRNKNRGWPAIYQLDEKRSSLLGLCKPFSRKGCPRITKKSLQRVIFSR